MGLDAAFYKATHLKEHLRLFGTSKYQFVALQYYTHLGVSVILKFSNHKKKSPSKGQGKRALRLLKLEASCAPAGASLSLPHEEITYVQLSILKTAAFLLAVPTAKSLTPEPRKMSTFVRKDP